MWQSAGLLSCVRVVAKQTNMRISLQRTDAQEYITYPFPFSDIIFLRLPHSL